jgi:recombination protein RecT
MSNEISIQDSIYSVEKDFNQVNSYKMSFAKEVQFALQLFQGSEGLQKAAHLNPASLEYAIINLASIGISLNPALKEAYLVPRGGKVCLDPSYIGLCKLATDTGAIEWVQAEIVKANDSFKFIGVGKAPIHEMTPFGDRGAVIGVYCIARLSTGEQLSTIMSKKECDNIRDKCSKGSTSWKDFYEEMLKKTCIKRAAKLWPRSERLAKAVDVSNEHEGIDFSNSKAPHVDQSAYESEAPTDKTFANLRALLAAKNKNEEGLLNYLNTQFKDSTIFKLEEMNAAQVEYAYRLLGGSK